MKISVVTLCLNGEPYLAQALESVRRQDWPDYEHLVLDGGSTDGSVAVIRAFAERNPRLRWWSGPDAGISDAMNRGLSLATGELVAFLHADDCYPNTDVLTEVAATMQATPNRAWLTGGLREIDGNSRLLRELAARRFSSRRLLRNNIVFHPATFVRSEVLQAAGGFDVSLRYAMDYDLWLRLARDYGPPIVIKRSLACFRMHAGSRSTACRAAALDEEYRVRKRYLSGGADHMLHRGYQLLRYGCEYLAGWRR